MEEKELKQTCLNLITNTFICELTTIDSAGFPHASAMLNLRYAKEYPTLVDLYKEEDNDFVIYMSTGMQSPKMARIRANPKACIYFCDTNQLVGVMLGGEIEIITDQKLKNRIWQKGWTMYYPKGPDDPTYGIIKLAPSIVKGWCNGPFEIKI